MSLDCQFSRATLGERTESDQEPSQPGPGGGAGGGRNPERRLSWPVEGESCCSCCRTLANQKGAEVGGAGRGWEKLAAPPGARRALGERASERASEKSGENPSRREAGPRIGSDRIIS